MGVGVVIGGSGGEGSLRRGSGDEWVKEDWLAKRLEFVTESMGLQERRLWALAWGWDYIRRASDERGWDLVSSVSCAILRLLAVACRKMPPRQAKHPLACESADAV